MAVVDPENASSYSCETVANNRTHIFLYDKYNGIPDTLIINLVVFVVSSIVRDCLLSFMY